MENIDGGVHHEKAMDAFGLAWFGGVCTVSRSCFGKIFQQFLVLQKQFQFFRAQFFQ
jgi:hypothetical protein